MRVEGLGFRASQLIKAALVTSAPSPPLPPLARNLLARATPDKTLAKFFVGVWGRMGRGEACGCFLREGVYGLGRSV